MRNLPFFAPDADINRELKAKGIQYEKLEVRRDATGKIRQVNVSMKNKEAAKKLLNLNGKQLLGRNAKVTFPDFAVDEYLDAEEFVKPIVPEVVPPVQSTVKTPEPKAEEVRQPEKKTEEKKEPEKKTEEKKVKPKKESKKKPAEPKKEPQKDEVKVPEGTKSVWDLPADLAFDIIESGKPTMITVPPPKMAASAPKRQKPSKGDNKTRGRKY